MFELHEKCREAYDIDLHKHIKAMYAISNSELALCANCQFESGNRSALAKPQKAKLASSYFYSCEPMSSTKNFYR